MIDTATSSSDNSHYYNITEYNNKYYLIDGEGKYCRIGDFSNNSEVLFSSCNTNEVAKSEWYTWRRIAGGGIKPKKFTINADQYPEKRDNIYEIAFCLSYARLIKATITGRAVIPFAETDFSRLATNLQNMALNSSGATGSDPTEKTKNLTSKMCAKLKSDHGNNVRIYVVEYGVPTGSDMAYIETCATDTGGQVKKAGNAAQLKIVLDEIAADLKPWGEYQEARLVN